MNKPMNGNPVKPAKPSGMVRVIHRNGELKLMDARDRPVPGVIACDIAMRPGVPPLMRINVAAGGFEVEGVPTYQVIDPTSGKFRPVKRVEFADGGPDWVTPVHEAIPPVAQPGAPATETAPAAEASQQAPQGQGDGNGA